MGNEMYTERSETGIDNLLSGEAGLAEVYSKEPDFSQASGEILFVTSYPPRECGVASYSQNLIKALNSRFNNFFRLSVCALENGAEAKYYYPAEVSYVLDVTVPSDYTRVATEINHNLYIQAVVIQHEFDLFNPYDQAFLQFLNQITKPVIVVFHTVIQSPDDNLRNYIQQIATTAKTVLVMAKVSEEILLTQYKLPKDNIEVIPYATHLIEPLNIPDLKEKYKLSGKIVLSTVGMLAHGKGIENTLEALPAVIKQHPEIVFLVIGKTHPEELKKQGEKYRIMLQAKVKSLKLQNYVHFLNGFFATQILKEYFQLSDICIFSCTDINRPMSGTFSLAVSCGCPIISTAASYAIEFLSDNSGLIYQGQNSADLASKINNLLDDPALRKNMSDNILRKSHTAIWENSALAHGILFHQVTGKPLHFDLSYPPLKLDFIKGLTDRAGILKSAYKGEPDIRSGYTLDDNAYALFVCCMHYKNTGDTSDIPLIKKYLKFIYHCLQPSGTFLKYMDFERKFTGMNYKEDLEETQAKAIWALGYLFSMKGLIAPEMTDTSGLIIKNILPATDKFTSLHAIALTIKGLYYYYSVAKSNIDLEQIKKLANKLVENYKATSRTNWYWFEDKFSESASIIPGSLLNTWLITGDKSYMEIAKESFDFLVSKIFNQNKLYINSPADWKSGSGKPYTGEQPYDIAFNVVTFSKFYLMFKENEYYHKMDMAFKWFLGNNRLNQMVYNPVTGSCYDGLDENNVNLNQSAESVLSYTLARMVVEKYKFLGENHINHKE